jgi:hypothetical protein
MMIGKKCPICYRRFKLGEELAPIEGETGLRDAHTMCARVFYMNKHITELKEAIESSETRIKGYLIQHNQFIQEQLQEISKTQW